MIKDFLHKIGFHFWDKSGHISRTCNICFKKQYYDYFYDGKWIDEEEL